MGLGSTFGLLQHLQGTPDCACTRKGHFGNQAVLLTSGEFGRLGGFSGFFRLRRAARYRPEGNDQEYQGPQNSLTRFAWSSPPSVSEWAEVNSSGLYCEVLPTSARSSAPESPRPLLQP